MLTYKVKSPHVISMWYACKFMLDYQIETPWSDIKIISLMYELEKKQKKTTKQYNLKLDNESSEFIWGSIKTCMDNMLLPNPEQLPTFVESMEMIAEKLDGKNMMAANPFTIIKGGKR